MCHYRHRAHPDPMLMPGLQDITAHVDFTAVAEDALAAGLEVAGFTSQAHFLLGCGLSDLLAAVDPSESRRYLTLAQQVKTCRQTVHSALLTDFDTPTAITSLLELVTHIHAYLNACKSSSSPLRLALP